MIYVIASSAFKGDSLEEHETILKIGYTKDENREKRFSNYGTHNPTYKILYEISDGTEEDEKALHEYFKNYKHYSKTKEWFKYCDEILEFFKTHSTIESIREDIILLKKETPIRKSKVFPIVWPYIVSIQEVTGKFDYSLVSGYRSSPDNFCEEWIKVYYPEESEKILTRYMETQLKITPEMKKFIDDLRGTSILINHRLKKLCEATEFTEEEKSVIAQQVSEKFDKFYNLLGPEKCRAHGYNTTDIQRDIEYLLSYDRLLSAFYTKFRVGERYTNVAAKLMIGEIYNDLKISKKTPKATDLFEYFIVKRILITVDGKKVNGLKLLGIKDDDPETTKE